MGLPGSLPSVGRARLLVAALLVAAAAAQFDDIATQFGQGKRVHPPAVRADLPHIRCGACQHFVAQAARVADTMRAELRGAAKLDESELIDKMEKLCVPDSPDGEWVRMIDIVEARGRTLELKDMGQVGKHTEETSTVARACQLISEDLDLADLSEALYKGKPLAQLQQLACHEMTDACSKKPPPVPKDRAAGPAFQALDAGELERERMMAKFSAMGHSGQMIDREGMKRQLEGMEGGGGEGAFPSASLEEAGGAEAGGLAAKLQRGVGAAAAAAAKAGGLLKGALGRLSAGAKATEL